MQIELPLFTNLLILLVTARLLGEIFEQFKQPSMMGEIIAGIILGPSLLGLIHRTEDISVISELGVFLLVIIAGLEIRTEDILKSLRGKNIIISIMSFLLPIVSGFAIGWCFDKSLITTIFIGLCIAITALPVSVRILMDLGKIDSDVGKRIISVSIFNDVLALTILGVIINVNNNSVTTVSVIAVEIGLSLAKLLAFMLILYFSYFFIKKLTRKGNLIEIGMNNLLSILKGKESLFVLFFAFVLAFSSFTESLGFHFIIGAFFASLLINEDVVGIDHLTNIRNTTNGLAMGFLAPIFFAAIGLEFNIYSIQHYTLLIAILAVSFFSKIAGGYFGGRLAGLGSRESGIMGIGLNARGIMELVIANIAYKAGLIDSEIFSILVLMGVLTTLVTPSLLKQAFKIEKK